LAFATKIKETRLALLADIRTIRKEMGVLSHDLS
jgi:hypothetical protein